MTNKQELMHQQIALFNVEMAKIIAFEKQPITIMAKSIKAGTSLVGRLHLIATLNYNGPTDSVGFFGKMSGKNKKNSYTNNIFNSPKNHETNGTT